MELGEIRWDIAIRSMLGVVTNRRYPTAGAFQYEGRNVPVEYEA